MEGGARTPPIDPHEANPNALGAASMEGGVRTPPIGSLRLGALTREYSLCYERSPRGAPGNA